VLPDPPVAVSVPGTKITYSVQLPLWWTRSDSYWAFEWTEINDPETVKKYNGPVTVSGPSSFSWDAKWDFPGFHKIVCRAQFHPGGGDKPYKAQYLEYQQTVMAQQDINKANLSKAELPPDPEEQRKN